MDIHFGNFFMCEGEIRSIPEGLQRSYNSSWNDAVHDSFSLFIDQYSGTIARIHSCMGKAEALARSVRDVNIESLKKQCEQLISQIG